MQIEVRYYDGKINQAHKAALLPHDFGVIVHYGGQDKLYSYDEMNYIGALGQLHPVIELPNDARIEFLSNELPEWLDLKHRKLSEKVHHIEGSWRWIMVSFVAMVIVVVATFKWGIPYTAQVIAMQLPAQTLRQIGQQAEDFIVENTEKSQLPLQRQQAIQALYAQHIVKHQNTGHRQPAKIIFRKGGSFIQANALAIPNGTIILTDELIALSKNDLEILGVLAHEQGHLDERHSLQQALQSVGISILYVSLTGDISDILGSLPIAVATAQYSQKFELAADRYAITVFKEEGISPHYLADFLKRLGQEYGEDKNASDLLQSHPNTQKRIDQIQQYSR